MKFKKKIILCFNISKTFGFNYKKKSIFSSKLGFYQIFFFLAHSVRTNSNFS